MEKRARFKSWKKGRIPQVYDPFVNNFRIRIPVPQTFMTADDLYLTTRYWTNSSETKGKTKVMKRTDKREYLKDWLSKKNKKWKQGYVNSLPWETLPMRCKRMFQFMFENRVLYDNDVQNIIKKIKHSSERSITWEELLDLEPLHRALFFTYLKRETCYQANAISVFKPFLITNSKTFSKTKKIMSRFHIVEDLSMDLLRNAALYFENDFDVPGGNTDFRYRKLRNIGLTFIKGKPRSVKLVKRYAKVSDFRRKLLKGSMRSRRRKTLLWKAFQEKIHSAFFIRAMEVPLLFQLPFNRFIAPSFKATFTELKTNNDFGIDKQLLETSSFIRKSFIGESKLARSAVAARTDIGPIHNGRGYMLVFQSKFRKFIKLPTLIVLKSIGRILLRQDSEWNKDWAQWKKEIHINCTFDGEEFSQDDLPPRWLREGIQIKIVYPFRLKPWHTGGNKKQLTPQKKYMEVVPSESQELRNKKALRRKRPKFTYLTVLGYQTDIPFGTIQKEASFWKPVQKRLIRICSRGLPRQIKYTYQFIKSRFNFEKVLKLNLISFKELNFLFNIKQNKKNDFKSNETNWLKNLYTSDIDEMLKTELTIFEKSKRSIAIGGEIYPANILRKQLVVQDSIKKEFVAKSVTVDDYADLSNQDQEVQIYELNLIQTSVNSVSVDAALNDTNFGNFLRSKQNRLRDSKEMLLNLRISVAESFEESIFGIKNFFFKIGRSFVHSSNEFLALHRQLIRIVERINDENNLLPKDRIMRFEPSSQAYLYADIWNISMKKDLNLDLLISSETTKTINSGQVTNRWNSNKNTSSLEVFLRDPSAHFNLTTTKFRRLVKKDNCINNLDRDKVTDRVSTELFSKHIAKCVEEWGFWNKFRNLDEKNWNNWLDYFHRYNLPSVIWRDIAPQKWKVNLDKLTNIRRNTTAIDPKCNASQSKLHNYSIYTKKSFLKDRISNFNKIRKHRTLLQNLSDFVRNGDIQNFSVRQDVIMQRIYFKDRIEKISKKRKNDIQKVVYFQNSDTKIGYNSKFDLMLWLDPNFAKTKGFLKNKKRKLKDPLLVDKNRYGLVPDISNRFQEVLDELYGMALEDREEPEYIFRWKWKFEMEMDNFKNLVALTRMLGNKKELMTLCDNTELNLDLLTLQLIVKTRLNGLQFLSLLPAHHLSLVLDDQNLLYKIINPLLKFKSNSKNRIKKHVYKNVYNDIYISTLLNKVIERNCKQSCIYNIEDLLLLRRQREFRFLNCFLISRKSNLKRYSSSLISEIEKPRNDEKLHSLSLLEPSININQRIKRFLWPSHRLEELACTGRFCFGTTTGSRFASLKIRMYPIILI